MAENPNGKSGVNLGSITELFASHRTASNLLMAIMLIVGTVSLLRMNTQFFPDFGLDFVQVTVVWPGASAEDVDSNIIQAIEPEVRFLDSVRRVRSWSLEGVGVVSVEFLPGSDMQSALSNIETAVGQVTTLPEDSETPKISRVVRYDPVSRIVISGPFSEASLKATAKRIRDDLLAEGIDQITIFGSRDEEIWAEVSQEKLLEFDLTLGDVATRIAEASQDVPSGDTTGVAERQIRSLGLEKDVFGLGKIEIRALENGQKILLREIGAVNERFKEGGGSARRRGFPAMELRIQRAVNADALEIADTTDAYLKKLRPTLPPSLRLEQYDIQADLIRGRIDLLMKNGIGGLVLVLIILFVFLNTPTAFWVAMGIPTSLMATMFVMNMTGQSINMISLFGLIMALGIIVDDAIVVGEHSAWRSRQGEDPLAAAVGGARRMAAPVFSSSLTTIAAFVPLLVISDIIGQIIRAIPLVVIAVIIASLEECFFVLPGHMRGALAFNKGRRSRLRTWFNGHFDGFRDGGFRRAVTLAVEKKYITIAVAIAAFILSVGLLAGGRVNFHFFPQPEADKLYANIQFSAGVPREKTIEMLDRVEAALASAERDLSGSNGTLVQMILTKIGAEVGTRGGALNSGDHIGGLSVELAPSDERDVRTDDLIEAWRARIKPMAGLTALSIRAPQGGPPGREIDVRLSGDNLINLKATAEAIGKILKRYPGVSDVENDLPYGKRESILTVTPEGKALGFNTGNVGLQIRHAFEGAIAKRFARGDEEVTVRVRLPRGEKDTGSLDGLYLRSPAGVEVPLEEVVSFTEKSGFSRIKREDGLRQVSITGEIDESLNSTNGVVDALARDGALEIAKKYGVTVSFAGKAEEQSQTLSDMGQGAILGLVGIYIILAWVFASYFRPLVVMSIIPLGFVGAVLGHLLLGYDFSILSLMALIGLSGIVVNDSIILVSTIDELTEAGDDIKDAIVEGACARLRAVILTSATTMGGLTPLLFETSLQAQFLIPMAVTLVFGLFITTFLVLLVAPALIAAQHDIVNACQRWWKMLAPQKEVAGE
ncbi:MAG: efflux RND transporter permease subunit [Alphaproteobacteria bacterium]|nr:efflux RND transporter permease subunit [Alphaproteobacteria bacterium]